MIEILKTADHIDPISHCLYRYVNGIDDNSDIHSHEFFEIFITVSGTVHHFINGKSELLPEGSLVFIRPSDKHGYIYESDNRSETAYINLTFTPETAKQLFDYLSDGFPSYELLSAAMPPFATLSAAEKNKLVSQISELNGIKWQDKKMLKLRMRLILADIFTKYFFDYSLPKKTQIPIWLIHLTDMMRLRENFTAGITQMTELSGKSREHIARSIKKYYGISASEYINEFKTNYAANMLLHTNLNCIDICFESGFQNLSWFYTCFEKNMAIRRKNPVKYTVIIKRDVKFSHHVLLYTLKHCF